MPTKTKLEADINDLVSYLDDGVTRGLWDITPTVTNGSPILSRENIELIIDALVFYKEMNTY